VSDGGQDPEAAPEKEEAEAESLAQRLPAEADEVERETGIEPATFSLEG
jgi:hypothetical protein